MVTKPLFLSLFRESPLKGIEKHMEKCANCAHSLTTYFDAVFSEDWSGAEDIYEQISKLEEEADEIKHGIRSNLPRTLLMQLSRQDLLELLHAQDKIANTTKDIAGLILGRKMTFPVQMHEGLRELVKDSVKASSIVNQAVEQLHDAAHLGFSDKSTGSLEKLLDDLQDVEHECDLMQRQIRHQLFGLEKDLDPVPVMFIYRIIDLLGDISDESQSTGHRVLSITFS